MKHICDEVKAEIDRAQPQSIKDMAGIVNKWRADVIDVQCLPNATFLFVFKDDSYMKITFTGMLRVDFELGTIKRVAKNVVYEASKLVHYD